MKALRIIVKQNQAHYRKEETITNKMTYPLPPFSTVIGALHAACGFTKYHPMNISVQGKYESMQREPYTDHAFLNSVMDDRGILVKLINPEYRSAGYQVVAKAEKAQGNSFDKGNTIDVVNTELLEEYCYLRKRRKALDKEKKEILEPQIKKLDQQKKEVNDLLKGLDKSETQFKEIKREIKEIANKKQALTEAFKEKQKREYEMPYRYFASLTTSLRYYEVLYGVYLIIHVQSDEETMKTIKDNIWNLTAIGRSEDFVELISCEVVELTDEFEDTLRSENSAYLDYQLIKKEVISLGDRGKITANGTVYALNKDYQIENNKRVFTKKLVVYTGQYEVDDESQESMEALPEELQHTLFYDGEYIVNLM